MKLPRHKWHLTIRVRLTMLYATAFFLAGLALIGLMYFQLNQVIGEQLLFRSVIVDNQGEGEAPRTTFRFRLSGGSDNPSEESQSSLGGANLAQGAAGLPGLAEVEARLRTARAATLRSIMVVSIVSLVAVSAVATILGWLLAGQALQPLREITATARGIADRNLHQRIAMEGQADEVKVLADTLDDMLERLDRAFDSQQRFIANASHELRTPLAINRTLIEVAMMKESSPDARLLQLGSTLLEVNRRHERLIEGLLMLASSEQAISEPSKLELAEVAQHVLSESAGMAQEAGTSVHAQLDPAPCMGDPVLLERLIQNLVDNAIRYNQAEAGWIRVSTGVNGDGRALVSVENSGPIIPSYEVPRLFEPFRRLSATERLADSKSGSARRGAGLGLSIVRSIVTSHGGDLEAVPRQEGGLHITILLPGR